MRPQTGARECLLMARTYRQSHLLVMSGLVPGSDIPLEMSASPLAPDVADTPGVRGLLTQMYGPAADRKRESSG